MSTMAVWRGITWWQPHESTQAWNTVNSHSCDGEISVLYHCLTWSKFVNTHLSHSRQWFNIHVRLLHKYNDTAYNEIRTILRRKQGLFQKQWTVASKDLVCSVDHFLDDLIEFLGCRQVTVWRHADIRCRPQQALADTCGHVVRRHLVIGRVVTDPP